jgi:hypothetical protein
VNPYDYQKKCIGEAVSILMSLRLSSEERIAGAMGEFRRAFDTTMPSGEALDWYLRIRSIMGDGPTRERIPTLTDANLSLLSEAFWELDRKVQRAYYEAEHGRGGTGA